MSDRFTEKAENALNRSVRIAERFGHTYIGSEHLLLALAEDELCCASMIMKKNGIDKEKIKLFIKEYSGTGMNSTLTSKDLTPRARKILEASYDNAIRYGEGTIGTEHILLALIEERDSVAIKLLKSIKADTNSIKDDIHTLIKGRERTLLKNRRDSLSPILKQYGKNLCELAREGKFDPVIGRDTEMERLIRILTRKNKNNPCLIGEAGVGKTAIVEGLAQKIVNNEAPSSLLGKTIISVDLTSMVAGAKYRGDFEERIKNIINDVIKNKDIILFIDELHTIVGAGAAEGAIDASNILKPQLARGDLQIIGATTFDEYRRHIEKDPALERRFQPIRINEPSEKETVDMLRVLKQRYEEHHGVIIDDDALKECVALSNRYINDRYLPDKAIDILDESCSLAASKMSFSNNFDIISRQRDDLGFKSVLDELSIAHMCKAEYPTNPSPNDSDKKPVVTNDTVKTVISEICGIPSTMINKKTNFDDLERRLNSAVYGQENAIDKLVSAIKRSDLGFNNGQRPRGLFMFIGESGVGKTALAVELEKNLFFNSSNLLRFDMSEYAEKQSLSKLIGSPPGYAGHEDGGILTEAVRKKPHAVVLFDEIEKADREILNIILQIADYGYLTDSSGRHVSFKDTIIIVTSNIGAASTVTDKVGFSAENYKRSSPDIIRELKKYYPDELIGRFDEIIYFNKLNPDTLSRIVSSKLESISSLLLSKGYTINFDENILDFIVKQCEKKGLGARAVLHEVSTQIEDKIIDLLVSNDHSSGDIEASIKDEKVCITLKNTTKT